MAHSRWYIAGLVTQSLFYAAGGINHFVHSRTYVAIMPPHYSHPLGWVQFTGAAEIAGAAGLLVPQTRRAAAWGLIAMLAGYYDVHIYMATHPERFSQLPSWLLYARLPLQLVLIAWAGIYARRPWSVSNL
jgi:uncharacterized membrane protein